MTEFFELVFRSFWTFGGFVIILGMFIGVISDMWATYWKRYYNRTI